MDCGSDDVRGRDGAVAVGYAAPCRVAVSMWRATGGNAGSVTIQVLAGALGYGLPVTGEGAGAKQRTSTIYHLAEEVVLKIPGEEMQHERPNTLGGAERGAVREGLLRPDLIVHLREPADVANCQAQVGSSFSLVLPNNLGKGALRAQRRGGKQGLGEVCGCGDCAV